MRPPSLRRKLDAAHQRHTAAVAGLQQAEAALDSYVARVAQQQATTPSTFGDRRAAADLARLELTAAERALEQAERRYTESLRCAAADRLTSAGDKLAELENVHGQAIQDALQEPLRLAREQVQARDELISELIADAEAAGAPSASLNTWSKDGVPTPSITMPAGSDLALVRRVESPTPIDLRQRPHVVAAVGGRGVAVRGAAGRVVLHRLALDPETAARELVADLALTGP